MDWDEYKRRCDTPGVLSRWMLERTAEVVPVAAEHLLAATSGKPLPKPEGHKGGSETDMFELHLDDAVADAVLAGVERAHAAGNQKLRGFVAAWREYRAEESDSNVAPTA
ncbi:MAG: hypothetical protein OXH52_11850 [Gammaproteobacteria bacterium]|nr:hypothetical protein [Gammaproteobacteria bacterium]